MIILAGTQNIDILTGTDEDEGNETYFNHGELIVVDKLHAYAVQIAIGACDFAANCAMLEDSYVAT